MKSYPKHPRIEDKAYLEFIRHEPCLACVELRRRLEPVGYFLGFSNIEAHHPKATRYGGNLGWNVKADDRKAMPLCRGHHSESENGEERFYRKYGIEPHKEIIRLNAKYELLINP